MRILLVHEIFPPDFSGGGEKLLINIIQRLRNTHDFIVLTSGNPEIKEYKHIPTIRVPIHRFLFNLFSLPHILSLGKNSDLIITNTYHAAIPAFIASRFLRKKAICIVHGAYGWKWLEMKGIYGLLGMILEKIIFSLPFEKFLFFSNFAMKEAMKLGMKKERGIVIYPGVDIKNYKKKRKEKFVLFVGRLERQKGIDRLIEVAKLVDAKFVIVGKGKMKVKLPNVEVMGFVPERKLRELYKKALIFFLPSRAETLGYSILEAMSYACVIISTVPLPYKEFHIKNFEKEKVAKKIISFLKKYKYSMKIGQENKRIIKKSFRWEIFVERFDKLINALSK